MSAIGDLSQNQTAFAPFPPIGEARGRDRRAEEQEHQQELFVQLPVDGERSPDRGYQPALLPFTADGELGSGLRASGIGAVPLDGARQAVLVGAFLTLLHRYAQQSTVAVRVHVGRPSSGAFASAVVQCTVAGADPALVTIAAVAKQLESLRSPLDDGAAWAEAARPEAGAGSGQAEPGPLPNIAMTFLDLSPPGAAAASGGHGNPSSFVSRAGAAAYDLQLVFAGGSAAAPLVAVYNARLLAATTVRRLVEAYLVLVGAVLDDSALPVHRLPVLSESDRHKVTVAWDSGQAAYPLLPVHHLFRDYARAHPEKLAADFRTQRLTYGDLDRRSSQLAHHLLSRGAGRGVPVAVCVQPSFDVLVGMLAVFKAGGIYLPLDPTHPEVLLATILDEARPALVLTQAKLRPLLSPERFSAFCFDEDWDALSGLPDSCPESDITLAHPAYQLYTSGTTGPPKGVVATHGNLAHYIHVAQQKYGFNEDDRFCSLARYTFSISMFELLSPLCCGGSLRLLDRDDVLTPERLARTLEEMTVLHAGPSLLGNLLRYLRSNPAAPRSFPRMRHASSGGDLVPPHLLEEMKTVFENAEIFVIYGCTEISCMGTTYPVSRERHMTRSFVGKPFPDVVVRLVDPHLNLVPFGVVGEICFSGKGVVPGYFKRPELTAEKFVALDGRRFYRTGDLGRLHANGNLEILGRRDFQVQVRGIRIELAGIENTIRELGLAFQCAVLVKKIDEQDVRLVAFVVRSGADEPNIVTFRRALAQRLPDYMLPQSLVVMDALPLTSNGKLDRKSLEQLPWQPPLPALPSPLATAVATVAMPATPSTRVAPRDGVERNIAKAFSRCLGVPADVFGIDDDFFDLGGHSLLAVMLLDELEDKLGVSLPAEALFEHTTVRALAAYSQKSFTDDPRPILLNANKHGPDLFVLVGVHLYRELAKRLEEHYAVRAVYAARELVMFDSPQQAPSVDELARDYVRIIRRHQRSGPYRLVGMSFGGIVAYEVGRQLRNAGEQVSFIGLLDAVLPERGVRRRVAQLRRLGALPPGQLVELISTRAHRLLKTALNRGNAPAPFAEYQKYAGQARLLPLEDQRQEAYRIATEDYVTRMTPFAGNVTLVVAAERLRKALMQSPCLGWSVVVPRLRVRNVAADHLQLLERPHVDEVARIFLDGLSAAGDG